MTTDIPLAIADASNSTAAKAEELSQLLDGAIVRPMTARELRRKEGGRKARKATRTAKTKVAKKLAIKLAAAKRKR